MKPEDISKMLLSPESEALHRRFGKACTDPQATITAVHDFASFERVARVQKRRTRIDRLHRLYGLYLAISSTQLPLSVNLLQKFKETLPDYTKVSMSNFLEDIDSLRKMGVVIVRTPLLDALQYAETFKRDYKNLLNAAQRPESEMSKADKMLEDILDSKINLAPPPVWPNV